MRATVIVIIFTALLASNTSDARSASRAQVEQALSAIEYLPTKAGLLALGDDVPRRLREIALTRSRKYFLAQNRAITMLRLFPSKETRATLMQLIKQSSSSKLGVEQLNLRQALASYATVAGAAAVSVVEPFLAHKSPDVRYAAAGAMALTGSAQGLQLLQSRLGLEKQPMVQHQLKKKIDLMVRGAKANKPSSAIKVIQPR